MKYYFVAEITIVDSGWVGDYVSNVTRLVERMGGRYLARIPRFERVEGARNEFVLVAGEDVSNVATLPSSAPPLDGGG